eukprot:scaffold7052_cov254-Pinguiococcus_pyrenoidosus.AAC.121
MRHLPQHHLVCVWWTPKICPVSRQRPVSQSPETDSGASIWQRLPAVPSIPTREQSYGYAEEESTGALVMLKPSEARSDGVVGPGHYSPRYDAVSNVASSKKVLSFGQRSSTRPSIIAEASNAGLRAPGPGYYNAELAESGHYSDRYNLRKRPTATFRSKSSRNALAPDKQKATMPGPGTYEVASTDHAEEVPRHLQCFGSTSQRMPNPGPTAVQPPGPGAYVLPKST